MVKQLLKDLIAIDSSTKEGANETVEFCQKWLIEQQLPVVLLENNGYKMLLCEIGSGKKTLVWNGHVDVVSGKPDQFIPLESDGKLYGRGAADMKAGVAAMMCAMVSLKDKPLGSCIQLQIVSDEETGGFHGSGYLAEQGYKGDFVICSEPTQLGIGLQAKGIIQLDIEVKGKAAHGSRPWEGVNAIEKAMGVYHDILQLPFTKESSPLYSTPSINLAKINGGEIYNKVPDRCILSLDIRFLPTQTIENILQEIKSITGELVMLHMYGEPVRTEINSSFIQSLCPLIEKYTHEPAVIFGQHGSADTRFFSAYGIPAIEFGPSGANWHGDEEYVEMKSVEQYKQMLVEFALQFEKIEQS
ncbi:MAG TPA: M20/M25/M40 family metallo-hydrolase [Bacillus sp. (in: firmicutes)]|nr:M20/M25/M40 family metallo-hydrolase [Bacillus sp. (in: firmicutes)]